MSKKVSFEEPVTFKQSYDVSTTKKLIALNKDVVNFRLTFKASSVGGIPFYLIVLDQDTINNTDMSTLEFKRVEESLSGQIVMTSGEYKEYYLILFADASTIVDVETKLEVLTPQRELPPPPPQTVSPKKEQVKPSVRHPPPTTDYSSSNYLIFGIVIVLLIIGFLYVRQNKGKVDVGKSIQFTPNTINSVLPSSSRSMLPESMLLRKQL